MMFKSRNQFLKTSNISKETFDKLLQISWYWEKSVLLHEECPLHIRDYFTELHNPWWKRLVAILASKAPVGYWKKIFNDPAKQIKRLITQHNNDFSYYEERDRKKQEILFNEKLLELVKEE